MNNLTAKLEKSKKNIQKFVPLRNDSIMFIFTSLYLILILLVSIGLGTFSEILSDIWTIINFPFFLLLVYKVHTSPRG